MRLSTLFRYGLAAAALALAAALQLGGNTTVAEASLEARKQPMRFAWHTCQPNCHGWVSAVGIVTVDTPAAFNDFARGRDLKGATIVLDSSGGSVNDALKLGRAWRQLEATTSIGVTLEAQVASPATIQNAAYCESMCAFLLLSGATRYVPDGARVRVHQIWMGDRADDAQAASYSAQDLMVVERDIGRLAKYTFDMGGTGDLLALALSVPPWQTLHEMSADELRTTNLITTEIRPYVIPAVADPAVASISPKPTQDRFSSDEQPRVEAHAAPTRSTKSAEATGGQAPTAP